MSVGSARARRAGALLTTITAAVTLMLGGAVALVASSTASSVAVQISSAATAPAVTAFQREDDSPGLIDRNRAAITTVGVDGVTVRADGASVHAPSSAAAAQLARAHRDGLRAELLVSNYSDSIGDFSEAVGRRLLADAGHRRAVASALSAMVTREGWDGISVDLESLAARDTSGLTAFVQTLRTDLLTHASLSICVMSSTRPADYAATGYDLRRLDDSVGRVILMTYDQHGPWENTPGPVGALPWQRASVAAARHFLSAASLDLGIAGYGYAWRPHSNDTLSDAQARRLAGSHARFDTRAGEWTATLPDGSTLWWSDARSYRLRVMLARQLGLHGVAMWALGLSDPLRAAASTAS